MLIGSLLLLLLLASAIGWVIEVLKERSARRRREYRVLVERSTDHLR
jgi:hypothetical protein